MGAPLTSKETMREKLNKNNGGCYFMFLKASKQEKQEKESSEHKMCVY